MRYVDGFVLPVPKDSIGKYREISSKAGAIWKEHGALEYIECVLDDPQAHTMVPFPALAGAKEDETVIFAWIVYPSKEARDGINAKVMSDPRLGEGMGKDDVPFDYTRMAYGGFRTIVEY